MNPSKLDVRLFRSDSGDEALREMVEGIAPSRPATGIQRLRDKR
jgi:hypothetical protein